MVKFSLGTWFLTFSFALGVLRDAQATQNLKQEVIPINSEIRSEASQDKELVSVDLSFDGFLLSVAPLPSKPHESNCSTLVEEIQKYKSLLHQNRESVGNYLTQLKIVLLNWSTKLLPYNGKMVRFAPDTFKPFKDLVDNINGVTKIMESNSILTDDFMYAYTETVAGCKDDKVLLGQIEQYSVNIFATQAEFWRYLNDTALILNKHYEKFLFYEGLFSTPLKADEFNILERLGDNSLGSGGVGEILDLYLMVFVNFYDPELKKIEQKIKEASHVKRTNN
jgi:hypothetical protein